MKVFIVSDMEGVAGIVRWQQVTGGHAMYEEGRRLYTGEINAAVRGAKAAGATEIVVMDCHGAGEGWTFNSLIPEELDADCEYVVQNEWTEYVDYLEGGVDAALFVGMHAMAGTRDGVLAHTVSGSSWWRLRFNGVEVGETGINAALCGTWGCPVLLVTGDEAACREGRELLGAGLTTAAVKQGLGRFSARQLPAARARELIEDAAQRVACPISPRSGPTSPGRRARSWSTSTPRITSRSSATGRASRSRPPARSPRARTTGGRPGGSSSSEPRMTVVACLGDSITEGSPYWDSRRRAGDPEGQWEHWARLRHPELEFRNHGIWGERTDEIAAAVRRGRCGRRPADRAGRDQRHRAGQADRGRGRRPAGRSSSGGSALGLRGRRLRRAAVEQRLAASAKRRSAR